MVNSPRKDLLRNGRGLMRYDFWQSEKYDGDIEIDVE